MVNYLNTTTGTTAGGTQVILTGSGFTGASEVLFGGVPSDNFIVNSDTQITAFSPSQDAGTVPVQVVTPSGTSAVASSDDFTYTNATAPTVSSLSTSSGTTAGGTVVTLTGSGFTGATGVNFGSEEAEDFQVLNDTTLVATAPAQAAGTYDVTVTTPSGTSATGPDDQFTYSNAAAPTVTGVTPNSASAAGGQTLVVTGSAFTGATAVNFGSTADNDFVVNSDDSITVTAPAGLIGTLDVTVTTPSGTSTTSSADQVTFAAASAPTVTGLSTNTGSTAGGNQVILSGSGFSTASEVDFGGVPVYDFTINSDSQITVDAPSQVAGTVPVTVVNAVGSSAPNGNARYAYAAAPTPAVTGLSTSSGTTAGGTSVIITGTNFTGATEVNFGSTPAADFTVNSDTSITAVAPPQAAGTYDITVTTPSGSSEVSSADQFSVSNAATPSVTSLATSTGSTAGGTLVTINGSGFTGATAVNFGSVAVSDFTVNPDGSISVYSPSQTAGTVHVTVTTFAGTSATSAADEFTYTAAAAPSVTGVSPDTGTTVAGNTVVITGSGFTGATAVSFGSVAAQYFEVNSDDSITAYAPPEAAGTINIQVTTPSGTSTTSSADEYTFTNVTAPAPAITSVSPNSGSTAGGQTVLISGTNFSGATAVTFGGTAAASFTILNDSEISVVAPAVNSAGAVDVQVTTNNGTSATGNSDLFDYLSTAAPAVTQLSTSSGSSNGGMSVTITGSGFTNATAVDFGDTPAASFTVNYDTSITATSPSMPAGTVDVTVVTPSGTSATSSADQFGYTAAAVPVVSGLGTTSGSTGGGTSVTIDGSGFTGATGVTFGGIEASSFTVNSDTSITATAPPDSAGTIDIQVDNYSGPSALNTSDRYTYTAAAAPVVSELDTSSGTTAGGTSVTITGSGFTGASAVNFGTVAAAGFTVTSDTSITAVAPAQYAGTVDITVTTPTGTSATSSADPFTVSNAAAPSVTGLGTTSGSTGGGTSVTIDGSGFTAATAVNFGGLPAESFTVNSDSSITATAPPQAAGTVDVTVTTYSGTSTTSSADQYTYTAAAAPSVTGIAGSSGDVNGGTQVTVLGSGFTGASAVNFGGNAAWDYTVLSDNAILATAPAGTTGTVDITVTTPTGTSSTSSADQFTYTSAMAPTVSSLGTTSGSTGGGTAVTINGSGFTNAASVSFGGVPAASFWVISDTEIGAIAPPQDAGTYDVSVTNAGGTSALSSSDRYTYTAAAAPTVTSLGTSSGTTAGGTSVTINGSGFTGAGGVYFGGVVATSFTVNSDSSITAIAPSQAAGTVDVTVATPTGTSATSSADQFTYSNAAAPSVTGLSLTSGSTGGGTVVTIDGSGFTGATGVNFGSVAASFEVESDGTIVATAPPQASGTIDVTVTTPSGTSATSEADQFTYTAAAAPTVTGIADSSGSVSGGTQVTVLGSGFTGASAVNFGGTDASDFTVLSDNAILVTAPAGTAGTVDITVTTPSGTSSTSSADQFTYTAAATPTVTGLSTTSGSTGGGTAVIVTGTGFTNATEVTFGGVPADTVVVNSDIQLTVLAPPDTAGTVDVQVTTAAGTSATSSADQYTYAAAAAPSVTQVSLATGPTAGGNPVTIDGSGFTGATSVLFGNVAATNFVVNSDGSIFAWAPAAAAGTVDITVTTPSGTSTTTSADHYTFVAPPVVSGVSPNSGPTTGGTSVTISGSGFTGATSVMFGSVAATSFTVNSDGSITAVAPAGTQGTVNITVTTAYGTSTITSADQYTYEAIPVVTGVSPSSGPTSGGTAVTISGSGFTGATEVWFGSVAASSFTVNSDGSITAYSPAEEMGMVNIRVETPDGTSAINGYDLFTYES